MVYHVISLLHVIVSPVYPINSPCEDFSKTPWHLKVLQTMRENWVQINVFHASSVPWHWLMFFFPHNLQYI